MARRRFPAEPIPLQVAAVDAHGVGQAVHQQVAADGSGLVLERRVQVAPALAGEQVEAQVYGRRQGAWQARVVAVPTPAAERVAPPCPVFQRCGGCALQHLDPALHLGWKQERVASLFAAAGVSPGQWLPPLADAPLGYRRKARLGVRQVTGLGGVLVGFRERGGSRVVDMQACPVLDPRVGPHIGALRNLIGGLSVPRAVPQVEVAAGENAVALVLRHVQPLTADDLARLAAFEQDTGLDLWLQPAGPETAAPLRPDASRELLQHLPDPAGGAPLAFRFGPLEFVQVNARINELMVAAALAMLAPAADSEVLDLFCGSGNFSLPLARVAGQVQALEGSAELVARGRDNARRNGIDNVQFAAADLYSDGASALAGCSTPLVLLDPPRSGAEAVVAQLQPQRQQRVLYIACGPEALARDAALLVAKGFRLSQARVVDMFPQTAHVETMALFEAAP